ncbi:MAG: peptidase M48, partial [Giesbergeria sp.]
PMFTLSLATHPPADQRLDQLQQAMGNRLDGLAGAGPVTLAQRIQGSGGSAGAAGAAGATAAAAMAAPAAAPEPTSHKRKKK